MIIISKAYYYYHLSELEKWSSYVRKHELKFLIYTTGIIKIVLAAN